MNRPLLHIAVIVGVAACGLLFNLGAPRLWDRDEPRNARCAAEMLERGDWVVPTFNGELRAHKPVLLYWAILGSYNALGVSEFSARLPSALMGIATALLTYFIGARLFSQQAGLWAALALATSISFTLAGRAATPDAALLVCITAALATYVQFAFPKNSLAVAATSTHPCGVSWQLCAAPKRWIGWAAVYAVLGLAMLAKGPVGVVLPVAILGLFLLFANGPQAHDATRGSNIKALLAALHPERILMTGCRMRPLMLLAVVALIAGPWYIAVHLQTSGAFTDEFFFRHNLERATSAMEGHRGPIVYYLGAMLAGMFPWSILAVPVALEVRHLLRHADRWRLGILLALCWAGVWIAAFSLLSTKLPNYIVPAYPALALLVGAYVDRYLTGQALTAQRWMPWAMFALGAIGVGLAIALPVAFHKLLPGDEALGWLGALPIATAAIGWWMHRTRHPLAAASTLAVGSLAFCIALFGVAQVHIDRRQVSEDLIASLDGEQSSAASLAAFRDLEPSFVFYANRTIPTFDDTQAARVYLEQRGPQYLVLNSESLAELEPLPSGIRVVARRPKFLKTGETIVLGRDDVGASRVAVRELGDRAR